MRRLAIDDEPRWRIDLREFRQQSRHFT